MRKTVLVLTLLGSLASQPSMLETVWSVVSTIWSVSIAEEGCIGDPNGGCIPKP